MGLFSLIGQVLALLNGRSYAEESEQWFDDVLRHISGHAWAEGRYRLRRGRVYRYMRLRLGDDVSAILVPDHDEGADLDEVELDWWQRMKMKRKGSVAVREYER